MITYATADFDPRMLLVTRNRARALARYNDVRTASALAAYMRAHTIWEHTLQRLQKIDIVREQAGRRAA